MSLPRPVYPGAFLLVTRRCTQRQFLLRPDAFTNNAVIYCLAVAALRYGIVVLDFIHMSNHLHEVLYDRYGNAPAFFEHFHRLLAKCMNAKRGRWENFFSSEQVSVVRLDSLDDVIDRLVYVATNPVKDGLVARVDDWPGASGHRAVVEGRALHATRPDCFFSATGTMPAEITLDLDNPAELGDRDAILTKVCERVATLESVEASRRARSGSRVLGRDTVLRQSWRDSPTSREPRRNLSPTFAARTLWARIEAMQRKRDFTEQYRRARLSLLAGTPVPFPPGTYWLKRFAGVSVDDIPKSAN